jgi:thiosulfate/3-mercaptopyruvate sulfurtransferase
MRWKHAYLLALGLTLLAMVSVPRVLAQESAGASSSATSIPEARLIQPEALVQLLKSGEEALILQVGSRVMFSQAHIPGSDYAGPGYQASGIQSLENTVASLPKDKRIVLYCGCCPWNRCPNVGPAYKRLHDLGFTNVKVLYIANNFGEDWVNKGYPAVKGK